MLKASDVVARHRHLLYKLARFCAPVDQDANTKAFDVGYEAAKRDMARLLAKEMNVDMPKSLAIGLMEHLSNDAEG